MKQLSKKEMDLAVLIVKIVKRAKGKHNSISANSISDRLARKGYLLLDSQVRRVINHIRVNRLVKNLIASNRGYYIESDPAKVAVYTASLRTRARYITEVANSYQYAKVK